MCLDGTLSRYSTSELPDTNNQVLQKFIDSELLLNILNTGISKNEGWNYNSGNYLFTTDTK